MARISSIFILELEYLCLGLADVNEELQRENATQKELERKVARQQHERLSSHRRISRLQNELDSVNNLKCESQAW